jgi:DNA-binding phage protein
MSAATEQDHLEFVRERLRTMSRSDLERVAAQAGITSRTLYYMIEEKFDGARYRTVMNVHRVITEADKAKSRRKKKAEAVK